MIGLPPVEIYLTAWVLHPHSALECSCQIPEVESFVDIFYQQRISFDTIHMTGFCTHPVCHLI